MDSLDIQVVDSLTVNLNQEDYSTEGQTQNDIAVYVEDEQLLFEAALTQDSINLYTRETPDTIIFDAKEITDGISKLESLIQKTSKEATLIAKVAELKEALNSIDFTAIEQAIQGIEDVTAKEATLIQGVGDIIKAVENIDFTDLENSIAEVKNAVVNIDFSAIAKEDTLKQGVQEIMGYVENIDFSAIAKENTLLEESKAIKDKIDAIEIPVTDLTEVAKENTLVQGIASISQKVDNIVIPEVDTTPLAKEDTLTQGVNTISQKIDDIHIPELDKSDLAKEATLSNGIDTLSNKIDNIDLSSVENKVNEGVETLSSKIDNIDLSAVENKVQEESAAIQSKIDNIKLPEIDTTELAKQGENQEATNSAIYNSIGYAIEKLEDMAGDGGGGSVESIAAELVAGKKLIAAAITEKGVETSPTDSMMQMAENVGSIIAVEGLVYPTQSMQDSIVAMEDVNRTQTTWFFKNNNTISFQNLKRIKAIANVHDATFNIYNVKYEMPNLEQIEEYTTTTDAGLLPLGGDFIFPKLRHIDTASRYALIITNKGSVGDFIIDLPSLEGGVGNVQIMNCGNHSGSTLNVLCTKVRIGAATVGAGIQVYYDPLKNSPLLFLTDVEVMEGFAVNLNLEWCIALTRENIVNHIFNRIATLKAEVTKTISIPATPFALLTDEDIAIATNKGWTIKSI